jgi:hypothetical protein
MKKIFVLLASMSLMLLTGCSGLSEIGKVGDHEFHGLYYTGLLSKSHSIVIVHDTRTGDVGPASTGVGNGLISDLIGAGSNIGSAYLWGHSLRPDEYNSNETTTLEGGNSNSNADADSKSKSHGGEMSQNQGQLQGQSNSNKNKNKNSNSNSNKNKNNATGGGGFVPPGHQDGHPGQGGGGDD